ncbi:MAG: putative bacterial sensory transduction regulator [Pseudonocardiales bacterium]|nr:putative bacterial sensory transduction regulator [Pseudonocardiales bacterium]
MRAPSGAEYALGVRRSGDRLLAVLDPGDLDALERDELFHLVAMARPAQLKLDAALPATLELRLATELGAAGPSEPIDEWLAGDPRRSLCDAWFVARIAQLDAVPPLDARTLWDYVSTTSEDLDPGELTRAVASFLREQHPELSEYADGVEQVLGAAFGPEVVPDGSSAMPLLARVLTEGGAEPMPSVDGTGLSFRVEGDSGTWLCVAESSADAALIVYAVFADVIAEERRAEACELLCRWNSEQLVGSLDLDAASGRIVLRTSLLLDDRPPSATVLRRLLDASLAGMDDALSMLTRFTAGASAVVAYGPARTN